VFGAEFSDKVRSWIDRDEDLLSCVDPEARPLLQGAPRDRHYMGLDLAPRGDRTVVALTKIENDKIRLVYHEQWQAKKNWHDLNPHLEHPLVPYVLGMSSLETLEYSEIANWISVLTKKYFITEGYFDQYDGISFEQRLSDLGVSQIKTQRFTQKDSSDMFQAFKILMLNDNLELYDYVVGDGTGDKRVGVAPYLQELLELQGIAKGKNTVMVQAPQTAGKHDDFSDALVRAVWLAAEKMAKRIGAGGGYSAQGTVGQAVKAPLTSTRYHRNKQRRQNYRSKRG
jgi:hypothetical protein